MPTRQDTVKDQLIRLGICEASSIEPYFPKVRDRDDISVLKCRKTGVIFLSRSDHMNISHYEEKDGFQYWSAENRKQAVNQGHEDKLRRKKLLEHIVANRKWLDIGTGSGGILDELSPLASKVSAVEPQAVARNSLAKLGYEVFPDIKSVSRSDFDVVTLFHVFEHFTNPLEALIQIHAKMGYHGKLIIEVPQANDFLLSFFDLDCFKAFTLWSEHLILHTRFSLERFLKKAGFDGIVIEGVQRYPLANHLYWLSNGKPGGHEKWDFLRTGQLDAAYGRMLAQIDKTDTLIATAVKPGR